jgi:hypothetical protein
MPGWADSLEWTVQVRHCIVWIEAWVIFRIQLVYPIAVFYYSLALLPYRGEGLDLKIGLSRGHLPQKLITRIFVKSRL